jgi:putative transposase
MRSSSPCGTRRRRRPVQADPPPRRRQYTSIAFTERLAEAGIEPSVGSVGDAYDALAETVIGLFTTELIKPRGPWRTVEQVEIATLEYVDWLNHRRLYQACGDIPPAELEAAHYRQQAALTEAGHPYLQVSGHAVLQ